MHQKPDQTRKGIQLDYRELKTISNVLLTGSTGYLGCNILNQLLNLTSYNVFLLIRAPSSEEAFNRINNKFKFYFNKALDDIQNPRLFIYPGDIEKIDLGLSAEHYHKLANIIDSTIHCAALVKHYGEYDKFYLANVQSTINLLEFTKLTKIKDFHHISTYSILNFADTPNHKAYVYTEDDLPESLEKSYNVYVQTKFNAEQEVTKYRNFGINANIYRLGNLAFISDNYRAQENIKENAFLNWLHCLLKIRCIAED